MRLRGRCIETGEWMEMATEGARIGRLGPADGAAGGRRAEPPSDLWLLPGLFDIQVNGYGGHDFNGPGASPEAVEQATRRLWQEGVTHFCPTVITAAEEDMTASLRTLARACEAREIARSIPCVHVEGPFISPEEGPRGAHPKEAVRPADRSEFLRWQEASGGRVGLVTLAPEVPGALALIEWLTEQGIVVALGHTGASPARIRDAVRAGARLSTHLGNAAHAVLPRHPNYIWEQAAADELWASFILDGHHLPPSVARCLLRCKGVERAILTSDAISLAGMAPGRYRLPHGEVEVTADRRCVLSGTPYLSGSVISLPAGVGNAVRFAGVSPAQAVRMATLQPALLLPGGGRRGRLENGAEASVTLCRWAPWAGHPQVLATVVAGEPVHVTGEARKLDLVAA